MTREDHRAVLGASRRPTAALRAAGDRHGLTERAAAVVQRFRQPDLPDGRGGDLGVLHAPAVEAL